MHDVGNDPLKLLPETSKILNLENGCLVLVQVINGCLLISIGIGPTNLLYDKSKKVS
jgi:hypothetical protein